MKNINRIFAITGLSTLLIACGGGGGGGGSSTHTSTKTVSISQVHRTSTSIVQPGKPLNKTQNNKNQDRAKADEPVQQPPLAKADEPVKQTPPVNTWVGDFPHSKDAVPVYKLTDNDHAEASNDPNFIAKNKEYIQLVEGKNRDKENHYTFYLLDDNAYYGFYRDSLDMNQVTNNYVYSFKEADENKGDLSHLTANYEGLFLYTTRTIPTVVTTSNVKLQYKDGKATGEITSRHYGDKMFDVTSTDPRTLELNPASEYLDNSAEDLIVREEGSPDRAQIKVHFINGKDGEANKHIVGKGGNEKFWGVLGAEKK